MRCGKWMLVLVGIFTGLAISSASAQPVANLTGTYRCVLGCATGFEGQRASITQNGWDLYIVTESGIATRAWFDRSSPATRIWVDLLQQGAVYSPDGMTIQFDHGALWDRIGDPHHAAIAYCARRFRSYDPLSETYLGRDGLRHSCP